TVDAFVRMDHEHILPLVEAVHGAHGDAIHGFAANAAFVDDESQFRTPNTLERATLAKKVVPYTQQSELNKASDQWEGRANAATATAAPRNHGGGAPWL